MMLIASSNSDIEAADAAATLQQQIEEQVAMSTNIPERLERLQFSIKGQALVAPDTLPGTSPLMTSASSTAQLHPDYQATLDEILENSTVYKRALRRSNNPASSSSVVSRSWSIISGISMTQIAVLTVLHLPLYDNEIGRFRQLARVSDDDPPEDGEMVPTADTRVGMQPAPPAASTSMRRVSNASRSPIEESGQALRRINKELVSLELNPPEHFTCVPIGDDKVSTRVCLHWQNADRMQFHWQGSIFGPLRVLLQHDWVIANEITSLIHLMLAAFSLCPSISLTNIP
jgi:hypothetical protein